MGRACDRLAWPAAALLMLFLATPTLATSETGICSSRDIRNVPEHIERLRGCRVIEGQLSIVLMERAAPNIYENYSFPELREVTGYIMIYRAKGIRNLGDLFPNLTVIRGMQLFKDFALVIFDNEHLESLGLRSLTTIVRGGVRIQHNDRLCYTNTVDWSRIIVDGAENVIRSNYDTRLCGLCRDSNQEKDKSQEKEEKCHADQTGRLLCWDDRNCQKICPSLCGTRGCLTNGTCCDKACLGGCNGTSERDCYVCRDYSFHNGTIRKCVQDCPIGTYKLSRRCVTEQQCRSMSPPPQHGSGDASYQGFAPTIRKYKIFNNTDCVYRCPAGYTEEGDERTATCVPCKPSGCIRECAGVTIDSVAAAEQFKGCTVIRGKLEISLRASGGNTLAALESSLGEIREIIGCLQVTRSYPLVSLMFLKNLTKITGDNSSKYKGQVLHILNNPNLELLWDWNNHEKIEITGGSLYIHLNPKLCYNQILPLQDMTSNPRSNFTDIEVSEDSNGNQASCLPHELQLTAMQIKQTIAILTWNRYCPDDMRKLLGYSIFYIAADKENVTLYGHRDACSDYWNVLDQPANDARNTSLTAENPANILKPCNPNQREFQLLTQLLPFTRYAAYVKTYTTLQDKKGAQSSIIYFRTLPFNPSPPLSLSVESLTPHSVYIKWSPPAMPNGTVNLYHVEIQANSYNRPKILAGNYCRNPSTLMSLINARVEEAPETHEEKKTGDVKNGTCACREDAKPRTIFNLRAEEERMESNNFENDLQNHVYQKVDKSKPKSSASRVKRSVDLSLDNMLVKLTENNVPKPDSKYTNSTDQDGFVKSLYYELNSEMTFLTVKNMRHFTWYTVSIWACRERHENETAEDYNKYWCSERAYKNFRTMPLLNADVVTNVQALIVPSNKTSPEVNITWKPPLNPNGFVVAYNVHFVKIADNSQSQDIHLEGQSCLSADEYDSGAQGHTLRSMAPGNYTVKVTPITVSGPGNVSGDVYIFIPERSADSGYEWVWGVVGGCLVMMLVLAGGVWYVKRGLMPQAEANKLFATVNPEYVSTVYVPDEWEVPRNSIEFIRELGQGSFGMVYEGLAKNIVKGKPDTRCAVKTVNEHATDRERTEFLKEASVMKAFDTYHVVRLLGVVSRGQPTLVVMELMEFGDLKTYLRSHRPDAESSLPKKNANAGPPTLQNILQMAIEIADGMAYLSAKKFVHRDLAARNCMVAGDLTVKVGDFGMTRDIYETDYYRKGSKGLLPVRWMSPESLKDGVFSSSSDVWSYGVVLWEMATLAMQPYQGLSNEQVVRYVVEGGVMERPEHCPDRLYELMRACWAHRAASRPAFLQLVAELAHSAAPYFRQRSFFHTPQGQEMYALQRTALEEEQEMPEVNVGAVATGSGSNLFGVSGRLASWVRELSSLRSRGSDDAAAEPLQPMHAPRVPKGPNGVLRDTH